ncbi:MAG: thioesterase family protein [Acidimicrobiales bacterium]
MSGALPGPFELDADTALAAAGGSGGCYSGRLATRWNVGGGMNGGYLAAFCLRGVLEASALPDPLSMTIHYLSRPLPGSATVRVVAMREGRGHATYRFDLVQGAEELRATGLVLTGRRRARGELDFGPPPPDVPPPDKCSALKRWTPEGESMTLMGRLEQRVARGGDVFFMSTQAGEARTGGWTRLADGRPSDDLCAPLFLDCWPPAVFSRTRRAGEGGAPTLELTVHWRNAVPAGWMYARFETDLYAGGYVDESGQLWSPEGVLVAESRQLARYAPLPAGTGLPVP